MLYRGSPYLQPRTSSISFLTRCVNARLSNGRRIKCLTVPDDFSRECVNIAVDWGSSGLCVTRLLDAAEVFRGYPQAGRTNNGPEFPIRAFIAWAQPPGNWQILIQPGRQIQSSYLESFKDKLSDECLNEQ